MNKELLYSYNLLKKVYFQGAYCSIELNKLLEAKKQEKLNHSLITKITYGVLEKDIYLCYVVNQFVKKPCSPNILLLLKMGAYVNEFTDGIPTYALINECVEISKKEDKFASGFVNATLKNIASTNVALPNKNINVVKHYSLKYSYPEWFVKYLLQNFDISFVEEYLKTELTTLTHIRIVNQNFKAESGFVNGILSDDFNNQVEVFKDILNKNNIEFNTTPLPFTLYVDYQKLIKLDELKGKYVVQGLPSVLVALNVQPNAKERILDCTGAPGGKSALVAELCANAQITCADLHPHRVGLIKSLMKTQQIDNVTAITQDATKLNANWINQFDKILCDVPCSGIGVVNKKPDILLNKNMADVKTLSGVQLNILNTNCNYLKVGGTLIYSTCTIMKEENESVINSFIKTHPNFKCQAVNSFSIPAQNRGNMVTFYPNISQTEGFFIAKLTRLY